MIVAQQDGWIDLRQPPVALVVDASDTSFRTESLTAFARAGLQRDGRLESSWALSRPGEIATVAEPDARAPFRGRFLTPLVESGLLARPEQTRLVVMTSGPILDWGDWAQRLRRAADVVVVRLDPGESVHMDVTEVRLADLTVELAEEALAAVLWGDRIEHVRLSTSSVIHELPASFQLHLNGLPHFVAEPSAGRFRFAVGVAGENSASVVLDLRSSDGTSSTHAVQVACTTPVDPAPLALSAGEAALIAAALEAYARGDSRHACPKCGSTHEFERAFACAASSTMTFLDRRGGPLECVEGLASGSRFVVDVRSGSVVVYVSSGAVHSVGDRVLGGLSGGDPCVRQLDSGLWVRMDEMLPGAWSTAEGGLYVVQQP